MKRPPQHLDLYLCSLSVLEILLQILQQVFFSSTAANGDAHSEPGLTLRLSDRSPAHATNHSAPTSPVSLVFLKVYAQFLSGEWALWCIIYQRQLPSPWRW